MSKNVIFTTKLALERWQQNLHHLFTIVNLLGHKDQGGLDETSLSSVRSIVEAMQKDFKRTNALLDNVAERSLDQDNEIVPPAFTGRKNK